MTTRQYLYVNNFPIKRDIPETPWMDEKGLEIFKLLAASSKCYLEFGSGGSTIHVAKNTNVKNIISVDSDKKWVKRITESLEPSKKEILLIHCDIGEVGNWGVPINKFHIENYHQYRSMPWEYANQKLLKPDLILVDGRFRVASFLYSLLCAENNTTILFDDYTERPEYFIVEKFCRLDHVAGRMGVFKAVKDYSIPEICKAIAKYSTNPD